MTREEAIKWAKEIKAFIGGTDIQYYDQMVKKWKTVSNPLWDITMKFRIKPMRPFTQKDQKKLLGFYVYPKNNPRYVYRIDTVTELGVIINIETSFGYLLEHYLFFDGKPCGK